MTVDDCLQTSLLHYFWQTREESFFAAIRTRIHLAALAIKEKSVNRAVHTHARTHTHTRLTAFFRDQKGKTDVDFTEARDSEWQWHQLGHMQVCTSLQTDNHASTPPLSFLQAGCPSSRPTDSVEA